MEGVKIDGKKAMMKTHKEAVNAIDNFLEELKILANRAHREYEHTHDVNIEEENFDRLENKIHKFLKENISQAEADRFNKKLHPDAFGVSFDSWINFRDLHLNPAISYLQGLRQALEREDIELIFEKVPAGRDSAVAENERMVSFDNLLLHPSIIEVSRDLYVNGHYAQAILEAFKAVNNRIKEISGISDLDGQKLMAKVFDEKNPIIKLNKLCSRSEKDEQIGFRLMYMGAMTGIRNPKAHDHIKQRDHVRTLKYLAIASLLLERAEEGESQK